MLGTLVVKITSLSICSICHTDYPSIIAVENENDCNQVANYMIVCANVKQY